MEGTQYYLQRVSPPPWKCLLDPPEKKRPKYEIYNDTPMSRIVPATIFARIAKRLAKT